MAGEFRASMLITAETGQARIAIGALRGETDQLGAAATKAGQSAKAGGAGFAAAGTAAGATAAHFLQTVSAASALDAAIKGLGVDMDRLRQPATAMGTFAVLGEQSQSLSQIAADWRLSAEEARLYQAALDQVRAQYDPLFAASQRYEAELRQIAEAERLGAISAATAEAARARAAQSLTPGLVQVGQSAEAARAHVANLGFQANDIFMMMAAGQNPMMLAIQQGTQVAQVFGQMRASGQSLGAGIKSALLGMVNPLSLVTMGVIALGAWAVQSFFDTSSAADDARGAVDGLAASTDDFVRATDAALKPTEDLKKVFGETAVEARKLLAEIAAVEGWKASQAAAGSMKAIREGIGLNLFVDDMGNQKSLIDQFGMDTWAQSSWDAVRGMQDAFRAFDFASEIADPLQRVQAQYASLLDLRDRWNEASGADGVRSSEEQRVLALLNEQVLSLAKQKTEQEALARAEAARRIEEARTAGTENARMGGPTVLDQPPKVDPVKAAEGLRTANDLLAAGREEIELARLKAVYGAESAEVRAEEARQAMAAVEAKIAELGLDRQSLQAQKLRGQEAIRLAQIEADRVAAQRSAHDQMLAQFAAEARVNDLTARFGADSLEVAYARASAEREVYAAQLDAQGVSADMAAELLDAWDAARGIAAINLAAGIGAAAAQAMLLAQNLGISLKTAAGIANLGVTLADGTVVKPGAAQPPGGGLSFGGISGGLGGGLGGTGLTYGANPGSGGSGAGTGAGVGVPGTGKGGGGGGATSEAEALEELLAREREQIAALKVLDPVQAEIEKNHLALKDATDEEKLAVADLIAQRMKLEEIRDRLDEIGETGRSAFQQLLSGATSFGGAISMVLEKLAEMAASEAWDLIWGSGGLNLGGILGDLFGLGSAPAKADGGQVRGQGGPREDNLLHWLSAGEYVVNAAATAGALPLLEAINAGVPVHRLIDVIGGRRPAYADGGLVGGLAGALVGDRAPAAWSRVTGGGSANEARAGGAAARQDRLEVAIHLDNDLLEARITDTSTGVASRVTRRGLEEFSAQALPARVRAIQAEPRRIG